MNKEETCKLLAECDAGIAMAISGIDDVLPMVTDKTMSITLRNSRKVHQDLAARTHSLIAQVGGKEKKPNPMAVTMSYLKTNLKMITSPGDQTIADVMVDGCNMGMKSLHRYQNRYPDADERAIQVADQLITEEKKLLRDMEHFL